MPTVALKAQVSDPYFGVDARENADYHDREPSAAQDDDHHATIQIPGFGGFEIDPLEVDDEELAALNVACKIVNRRTMKEHEGKLVGARLIILPSDGRR